MNAPCPIPEPVPEPLPEPRREPALEPVAAGAPDRRGPGTRLAAALLAGLTRLVTGVQARFEGAAPSGAQRVYFANHSSHLDTLVIWAALPPPLRRRTRPVAAADYWDRPGPRRWLAASLLNALLVERAGGCGSREALRRIDAALTAGDSLILFPEGTRGDGETIGALRPGLYFVARQHPGVELVPVWLSDLNRILPKGEVLPVPIIGRASFGAPLPPAAPNEDREAFLARARAALLALGSRPGPTPVAGDDAGATP